MIEINTASFGMRYCVMQEKSYNRIIETGIGFYNKLEGY